MNPLKPKKKKKEETVIRDSISQYLKGLDWVVKVTHGNIYQHGFPDLYCAHKMYGSRWIEVKNPNINFHFTPAQLEFFRQLTAVGVGIWVLMEATEEEYQKLFKPANWWHYYGLLKN